MMLISNKTGKVVFTQMESETPDLFAQPSHCNQIDMTVGQQYLANQSQVFLKDLNCQQKLEAIGLSDSSLIERFGLGYADRQFQRLIPHRDSDEGKKIRGSLHRLGLVRGTGHGVFNGGVLFPLFYDIYYSPVGVYGYWCQPKKGFEPDMYTIWGKDNIGIFNLDALNGFANLIVCQCPVTACQLIERGLENVIAVMSNGDTVEHYYRLFKHTPTEFVQLLGNGDRYGQFWKQQVSEALRLLNIDSSEFSDA